MGHALKKDDHWWSVKIETIREASKDVSRTIDNMTDKLSEEIGQEIQKEEADKLKSHR